MKVWKTKENTHVFEAENNNEYKILEDAWSKCINATFDDDQVVVYDSKEFLIMYDYLTKEGIKL